MEFTTSAPSRRSVRIGMAAVLCPPRTVLARAWVTWVGCMANQLG